MADSDHHGDEGDGLLLLFFLRRQSDATYDHTAESARGDGGGVMTLRGDGRTGL